jgi:hypothetical protein
VCPKFGKNPVNDVGPREFTRNVLGGQDGMMNGSVTISPCIFVGQGIIIYFNS